MTPPSSSTTTDLVVLGLWHEDELVVDSFERLRWYAAMHDAAAMGGTWREFLARVAAVDEDQARLLREVQEPELDAAVLELPSNWDGLPWPGLPTEDSPPPGVLAALGALLQSAGGPGGVSYVFVREADENEALARLDAAGIPAVRDDALVGDAYADESW